MLRAKGLTRRLDIRTHWLLSNILARLVKGNSFQAQSVIEGKFKAQD